MKLIIAGHRDWHFFAFYNVLEMLGIEAWKISEIVSGEAKGIDRCAETFSYDLHCKFTEFPADWDKHGRAAGPIRNKEMAEYGDALLVIWDGDLTRNSGSRNMRELMLRAGKPVYDVIIKRSQ